MFLKFNTDHISKFIAWYQHSTFYIEIKNMIGLIATSPTLQTDNKFMALSRI